MRPHLRPVPPPCFICSGPKEIPPGTSHREWAAGAYFVGLVQGILAMTDAGDRQPLCDEHETTFREVLVGSVQDPTVFTKLGIPFKVADENTVMEHAGQPIRIKPGTVMLAGPGERGEPR
jgi:hypothetical protein